ncbi:MAG TPA: DUF4340 domain-containing protein [Lacunisphaera sp.]|jgi:hypothetical protein
MKLKNLLIVVVLLAAVSVIVFVVQRPTAPTKADPRVGQSLFEGAAIDQATKFSLTDQAKTVSLVRESDGNWQVASYYDLPADFGKLSSFVNSLTEAKIQRLVTSNPERMERLEFKDTKIELSGPAGKALWSVTFGKNAETSGRYVRFDNEQKAYLANFSGWLDTDSKNWANRQILDVKPEEIASVEIPFADGGSLKVSRAKKDDVWISDKTPAGEKLSTAKISSLLGTTGNLQFTDTTDPTDANAVAAKTHERVFKLTTFDGKTYTVAMGRKPEDKKLKPVPEKGLLPVPAPKAPTPPNAAKSTAVGPKSLEIKPATPEFETIPAGPVFVFISSSDSAAPINARMKKRAFEISDYVFTALPQKAADIFEAAPAPVLPSPLSTTKAAEKKKSPTPAKP